MAAACGCLTIVRALGTQTIVSEMEKPTNRHKMAAATGFLLGVVC